MIRPIRAVASAALTLILAMATTAAHAQVLDKQKLLDRQTFWDNRDWDWYKSNIPFFESPDADVDTTYYYRWELVTKHAVYGSPEAGYAFTEFIDRPFWSGRYGSISCPAGHQLYEIRWLKDRNYANDYARYWFRTEGAQPRRYSTWLADAVWAVAMVQGDVAARRDEGMRSRGDEGKDPAAATPHPLTPSSPHLASSFPTDLLDDLIKNYKGWEQTHFTPGVGLFWQTGHDEGMEYNISSRQTQDIMRGGPGYRPSMNAYMYADALAISRIARLAGKPDLARAYSEKAAGLKNLVQAMLWDQQREFFFHVFKQDETGKDGTKVPAMTKVHEAGKFAGSPHGREEIGFVPWQFNLPDDDPRFAAAWRFLMDPAYFAAPFGPTTTERNDPMFLVTKGCCWWSGQSWPYATTQTLVAMANLLNNYKQPPVTREDYFKLLKTYTMTQRKDGKPYIAEGANPDTGSWEGYDSPNHSEHYFHSGYCDLIITGLAGLRPRADDTIEVNPLIPDAWDFFALDDVAYHGHRVCILWDKTGEKYNRGAGLQVIVDGKQLASSPTLGRLTAPLPPRDAAAVALPRRPINYAVHNDPSYFPRTSASFTSEKSDLGKINDGQSWYHVRPTNRWTTEGSPDATDWVAIDFGTPRPIHTVKLYFLDDGRGVVPPQKVALEFFSEGVWKPLPGANPVTNPAGRRPTTIRFPMIPVEKLRAVLTHAPGGRTGLTEFEAWGDGDLPITPAPPPRGILSFNPTGQGFPKATASYTCRVDKTTEANDGRIQFAAEPRNRWTAYDSKNTSDWLDIDFGAEKKVARVSLYLYDDKGGVQAPASYTIQYWDGSAYKDCDNVRKSPETPAGGRANEATFTPVKTQKIRTVFHHAGKARSGVTEIEIWSE